MATYSGRRGPNVSLYLRELNAIPTEPIEEPYIEEDLSLFTNTQFFDLESGQTTDYQAPPVKPGNGDVSTQSTDNLNSTSPVGDLSLDFIQDFNFTEFSPYPASTLPPNFPETLPLQPLHPQTAVYPGSVPQQQQQQQQDPYAPPQSTAQLGIKRKSEDIDGGVHFEEQSRVAAEEDKRRRNTAASARFRVKKKQREQALEQAAKDMSDKVTVLEGRIQQLETENKWLKNMILEKNSGSDNVSSLLEKGLTKGGKDEAKSTSKADS